MKREIKAVVEYDIDFDNGNCLVRLVAEDRMYVGRGLTFDAARDSAISKIKQWKQVPRPETIIIEVEDES